MTWVMSLAALWLVVACVAALVIGRGLRVAQQRDNLRRVDRLEESFRPEVLPRRHLAG